ncbi:ATP-dependent RNA helicase HrpB [Cedecea neteri]|uniref:ATP-dependent RNA helicase HrpB n=1 Tax=Cedecea neteri TaxID=158822 RepID=A0A2X2SZ62_9ENTR|nr:ATP-dependent RNA helicase HrpB [Cedecea neteri]
MAQMGNDPRLASMLVRAKTPDEQATAAWLSAILEEPPRTQGGGDLRSIFDSRNGNWRQRSSQLLKRMNARGGELDILLAMPLLASGFADRIARRRGAEGRYQLANGMGAMLEQDDAMTRHEWLIAPLLLQGSQSPDARILLALPLDVEDLVARMPHLLTESDSVEWG